MMSDPAKMNMAVELFEQGFREADIERAVQRFNSLDAATKWLRACGAPIAEPVPRRRISHVAPPAPVTAPTTGAKRRTGKSAPAQRPKEASALQCDLPVAPNELATMSATSTPSHKDRKSLEGISPVCQTSAGDSPLSSARSSVAGGAVLSPGSEFTPSVFVIEPRDSARWWEEAAVRWKQITQKLRSRAHSSIAGGPQCSPHRTLQKRLFDDGPEESGAMPPPRRLKRRPPATPQHAGEDDGDEVAPVQVRKVGKETAVASSPSPASMSLSRNIQECALCCNETAAWRSVKLGCKHGWYCAQCMLRHAEARLGLGDAKICCPECVTPIAERDLRKLLPAELIDRLLARSLEQAVSSTSDILPCPTPNCSMRVVVEEGEVAQLQCSICERESCLRCGVQPFHVGLSCDAHAKKMLKKRGGTERQQRRDDESLRKWIESNGAKQCPICRIAVTKQNLERQHTQYSECHKMMCRNCGTRFCFKCLAVLTNSYSCGCSQDLHGFINPFTQRRIGHLKQKATKKK